MSAQTVIAEVACSTSVLRSEADLLNLAGEWNELFTRSRCNNSFLSFHWMSNWWTHLATDRQSLFLITVRDGCGTLIALAPFQVTRTDGPITGRKLGFIADSLVGSDFLDVLIDSSYENIALDSMFQLIHEHRSEWDFIELCDVSPDSLVVTWLEKHAKDAEMHEVVTLSATCPFVTLPDKSEPTRVPNYKYFLRRDKSIQKQGDVELAVVCDVDEADQTFEHLIGLHEARSSASGRKSAFTVPGLLGFHHAALKSMIAAGLAMVFVLKLRGEPVAALYGLASGKRLMYYQSGIDPAYGKVSPGVVLIGRCIQFAIESGCDEFHFLRGNEGYKFQWANAQQNLFTVRLFDSRAKSRLFWAGFSVRATLSRWKAAWKHRSKGPESED